MNTKPILFLDVDGVLNAFAPVRPHVVKHAGGRWVKDKFIPFTLHFDNEVADMVDALAEHFEIHWFTMWNQAANAEIAPLLGLHDFPVAEDGHGSGCDAALAAGTPTHEIHRLWFAKTPLLPEHAAGRPFAWLDDDHSGFDRTWLAQHGVEQPFLLVRTDADYGVQWDDVDALITWARNLAAGMLTSPNSYQGLKATVPVHDVEPVLWFDEDETPIDWESEEVQGFLAALEDDSK